MSSIDRRRFLRGACCLGAVPLLGTRPLLGQLSSVHDAALAATPPGGPYKALVCVYLAGGHDSFNLLVPRTGADYATYAATRSDLAVPQADILPVTPATPTGRDFGLHPAAAALQARFAAGRLAFVANVGTLVQPITRAQYQAGTVQKPRHLFSHSDQTELWESQSAQAANDLGWAGRVGDFVLPLNGGSPLSPAITIAGSTRMLRGQTVAPYAMRTSGTVSLSGTSGTSGARRLASLQAIDALPHGHAMERGFADLREQAIALDSQIRTALDAAVPMATVFPTTSLGRQLEMVARMIGIRGALGVLRQVFFVRLGGFDTHDNQLTFLPTLLTALGEAVSAFDDAMVELGVDGDVTLFTTSEFGRTLTFNGRGTDHGWGGVQFALGGAVAGGDIYGAMPDYALGGPDDAGNGRVIPTLAVEQYAATLASWFGVAPGDLPTVFPRLSVFGAGNLGFV
ncbi:MAG: DUF1501 domain-containing protein [Planctomycetota bacterium]